MPITDRNDARIHWQEHGRTHAITLILLHSIGTDSLIYDAVVPLLAGQFRLAAIDLRGHGQSTASPGDYSLSLLAGDVVAVMDQAGIGQAIVCGTSLGGMVAMQLAIDAPGRVRALALANTSAEMSPALWPERIATVRAQGMAAVAQGWAGRHFSPQFMAANAELAEAMTARLSAMDPLGYAGNAAAIRDMDVLAALPGIAAPTLVIGGEFDTATPYAGHGNRIAALVPGAEVAILPTGHLACVEAPDLFAGALRGLAGRCSSP